MKADAFSAHCAIGSAAGRATRCFCATCGTSISYEHADNPTGIDITACSLDLPDAFVPTHRSWLSDDLPWIRFGDGLPGSSQWRKDPA